MLTKTPHAESLEDLLRQLQDLLRDNSSQEVSASLANLQAAFAKVAEHFPSARP
jgi:hypothetical protein